MNIIICDDEKSTCGNLEQILLSYASVRETKFEVQVFFSGIELINYLMKEEAPDILFLDIELPGINGVAIGDYIRRELENELIFIVYISSKERYALQLFQNRPFDFLLKPLNDEKIFHVLDNISRIYRKNNYIFAYQNKGVRFRTPYRDILYFQSNGRKIDIVMKKETRSFYGKLTKVEEKMPKHLFLNIHKSYLVNFNYIEEYSYEWLKMVNGDILNISKANRATVRRKILERETDDIINY